MKFVIGIVSFCLAVTVAASLVLAEEAAVVDVTGVVTVMKDDDGEVTSITIKSDAGDIVGVTLDDAGKKLVEVDAQKVKATGTVEDNDGTKTITVQKVAVIE